MKALRVLSCAAFLLVGAMITSSNLKAAAEVYMKVTKTMNGLHQTADVSITELRAYIDAGWNPTPGSTSLKMYNPDPAGEEVYKLVSPTEIRSYISKGWSFIPIETGPEV